MDKRTLEKYEREAKEKNRETWYLAWALDTNQEERNKVRFCICVITTGVFNGFSLPPFSLTNYIHVMYVHAHVHVYMCLG